MCVTSRILFVGKIIGKNEQGQYVRACVRLCVCVCVCARVIHSDLPLLSETLAWSLVGLEVASWLSPLPWLTLFVTDLLIEQLWVSPQCCDSDVCVHVCVCVCNSDLSVSSETPVWSSPVCACVCVIHNDLPLLCETSEINCSITNKYGAGAPGTHWCASV